MSTQAQIAALDTQALFRELRAIKERELEARNAKMWALAELVRRGLAHACCMCNEPIDPEHARRFLPDGRQRHPGCSEANA